MIDSRNPHRHFIVGVIILIIGVILLLDQLGFTAANKLWPLILIYFGATKFSSSREPVSRFWGGFFALLGIALELEALGTGYIHFSTIWPVFLICIGVLLVLRHYEARRWMEAGPPPPPPPPPPIAPDAPGAPGGEPPPFGTPQSTAPNAPESNSAAAPGPTAGPEPFQAGAQQAPPSPPFSQPPPPFTPPPPGQANFYGSGWSENDWRRQRAWERFQRRMDRMSARVNQKWGPNSEWQAKWNNWQPNSNWQANPNAQAKTGPPRGGSWYESTEPRLDDVHVFWGSRRRIISKNFVGGEIVAIFGGFDIDLTQADILGNEAKLDIVALFGGGEVRVPPNWNVVLETIGIFGGASDRTIHPAQANAVPGVAGFQSGAPVKTLVIDGVSLFGGVTIKN